DGFVQINKRDAARLGIENGDWVRIASRRGQVEFKARTGGIDEGRVFIPFHYGYWDDAKRMRAANELTLYEWDPVSKQPHYKYAAVQLTKIEQPESEAPRSGAPTLASQ